MEEFFLRRKAISTESSMVTTSLEIHRPIPLPPQIREAHAGYLELCGA